MLVHQNIVRLQIAVQNAVLVRVMDEAKLAGAKTLNIATAVQ